METCLLTVDTVRHLLNKKKFDSFEKELNEVKFLKIDEYEEKLKAELTLRQLEAQGIIRRGKGQFYLGAFKPLKLKGKPLSKILEEIRS